MSIQSSINQVLSQMSNIALSARRNSALDKMSQADQSAVAPSMQMAAPQQPETAYAENITTESEPQEVATDYLYALENVADTRVKMRQEQVSRHREAIERRINSAKLKRQRKEEKMAKEAAKRGVE